MPIDCGFNDAQIFVQGFHRGAGIDAARRPLLELLSQSQAMRSKILKRSVVFEAQISFHDQFKCM
jgi:hypothetical protein